MRRLKSIIDGLATVLVLVASVTLLWRLLQPAPEPAGRRKPVETVNGLSVPPDVATNTRGTGNVVLVEFADFECPYCGKHARETTPAIKEHFVDSGHIQQLFINFPLRSHANAQKASEAAECAARQGQFWTMYERLFADPKALTPADLVKGAEAIGLDRREFEECLESGAAAPTVLRHIEEGRRLGVNSTPSFFIGVRRPDGRITLVKRINGAMPFEDFAQVIRDVVPERKARR